MSGWIRKDEYDKIKFALDGGAQAKWLAADFDRAIGTIYNIKNTEDHEDYCRKHNKRQYRAEYASNYLADASIGTWKYIEPKVDEPDWEDKLMDRLDTIEDDISEIKRMLNAISYTVKR